MKLAERLLNAVHNTLVVELAGLGVTGADIGRILRDFANARKHIWFTLARACATRCLQLKENISPGDPIHWLTEMLLFTKRGFREMVAFAQGDLWKRAFLCTWLAHRGVCASRVQRMSQL